MKRHVFIVLIILAFVFQSLWAQQPQAGEFQDNPNLPEGIKGARIQALIETLNSGSVDRLRRFLNEDCSERLRNLFPFEDHADIFIRIHEDTGGVEFHNTRLYTPERPNETVIIVKDRNYENWLEFTVRFAEAPTYFFDGFSFRLGRAPTDVTEPSLNEAQLIEKTEQLVNGMITRGVFSGTLLIARGDKILLTKVGGEANKSFHVPNNIDTKFNLSSMNKMFTATAIFRLIEQRKLSLDDLIDKYIDETWLPKEITQKITIRHLLTHTSGLGSYLNETFDKSSRELFRKLEDYKPLIKDEKSAFEPGERFQYSNTGMFFLGVVIEKITGEDYFDHIRKAIYEPAGMTDTDSHEMDYPVENLAIGYIRVTESPYGWQNNLYKYLIKGNPAEGGFSTVKDLHKFALALLSGKLVSKESLQTMWTDHIGSGHGYGFSVQEGKAGKSVGHSGGFPGVNAALDIYLDSGYIVAVMSNVNMGATPLSRKIAALISYLKKE